MLELTNHESDATENGNSKYEDTTDGPSRPLDEAQELEKRRKDLADMAVWMSGLEATEYPLDDPVSLCGGRAFAELLHHIDSDFFEEKWLETIPEQRTTSNIVVKRSNIRKLWRKMSDYITEILNREIKSSRWTEIGDRVDGIEETDLLVAVDIGMAIVAFALIGRNQEHFVDYSTKMTKNQNKVMENIARIINTMIDELPEVEIFLEKSDFHKELNGRVSESSSGKSGLEELGKRRRTLSSSDQVLVEAQIEIDKLREEKERLQQEVDRLTKALNTPQLDTSLDSESGDLVILEKLNEELRAKRRQAEERVLELEASLEHFQTSVASLTAENDTLRSGQKEFNMLRTHLDSAQSDVDEWRSKANQYQADSELLKKREKEVKELQGQVKSLNSRLEHHVKTATMEEDNKAGIVQLRTQIGTLTANNVELNVALESKKRIVEQLELHLIQHKEKVKELEDRKEDLVAERNKLQNELLFKDSVTPRSLHESMFEAGNLSFDFREPKVPLEIENKRLLERIQELEALEPLKGEIITLNSRNGVLEEQNLKVTKQMEELQRQVDELQEKCAKSQQNASGDIVDLKLQLERANVDIERLKDSESRYETKLADSEALMKDYKQKYEQGEEYLQKCKEIINDLEEKNRSVGDDNKTSVQAFHEIREENERLRVKNEKLEIMLDTMSKSLEQESRLITSSAHEMVLNRSIDEVMAMRAHAGSDEPQTLLESQKMSGALPWSIVISAALLFLAWISINIFSAVNAPPRA